MSRAMKFRLVNKVISGILGGVAILCVSASPCRGQELPLRNEVEAELLDSVNRAAKNAAEESLQRAAVVRDSEGNVISTSYGPVTPTSPYVPASEESMRRALRSFEEALKLQESGRIKDIDGYVPSRPNPPRLLNDYSGILTSEQAVALEQRLSEFAVRTSNQVAVVVMPAFYGLDKAEMAYRIGKSWGAGQSKFDNGVVILVKPKVGGETGDVFIAVGTGLEPVLTDALMRRVIELRLIPAFKENDYYNGINDALSIIFPIAAGEISTDEFAPKETDSIWFLLFPIIIFVIALCISAAGKNNGDGTDIGGGKRNRGVDAMDAFILGSILGNAGRSGRGGGFGGGGFGGFGGFGGGGFSGGGAGGSW